MCDVRDLIENKLRSIGSLKFWPMHKLTVLLNKVSPFYYKIKQVVHEVGMKSIEEQWV